MSAPLRVIVDGSTTSHRASASYKYFREMLPYLSRESGIDIEFLDSAINEASLRELVPVDVHGWITPGAPWLKEGPLKNILRGCRRKTEEILRQGQEWWLPPSVFHTFYYSLPSSRNHKLVANVLDLILEKFSGEYQSSGEHALRARKIQIAQRASALICISQNTKDDLLEFMTVPENVKVEVVYPGINHEYYRLRPPSLEEELRAIGITFPYLLQVGGRLKHKNFLRLAEAFAHSSIPKDIFLVCAGEFWSPEEKATLIRLGIEDRVRLFHYPDEDRLRLLYQGATLFVYPSLYEGFGFPLLEAMASGAPVVASNAACIPEVCAGAALHFNPYSTDDMASVISKALVVSQREELIRLGSRRVQDFSWAKCAKETASVYRSVR